MKYFELDKEEKEILEDFETGKLKSVKGIKKEASQYKEHAKQALNKTRSINIRLSQGDLQKIKALAVEKGIPYQTLVSSVLHQYSIGKIKEKL